MIINSSNSNSYCSSSNNNNDYLFFKCFRSIVIKTKIFSYLKHENSDLSYDTTTTLKKLASRNKFEIILDKLKSNHFIFINHEGIRDLYLETFKFLPQYNEIIRLLWNSYKDRLRRLNSLDYTIKENSIQQFKGLSKILYEQVNNINYNSNNSNENNNNNNYLKSNNNNNIIDQSYRLYSLMDLALENSSIEIAKYILELSNRIKVNNNGIESIKKKQRIDISTLPTSAVNNESDLKKLILSGEEIPIYSISLINNLTKDKLDFIENHLHLNFKELLVKFKYFGLNSFQHIDEKLDQVSLSLLLNGYFLNVNKSKYYFNSFNYVKIHLLLKIQHSLSDNNNQLRQYLLENEVNDMDTLIDLTKKYVVSTNSNASNRELYHYLGIYLIYHYLQQNNFKQIELLLNYSTTSSSILGVSLIFYYSIFNLSIDTFNFYLSFINSNNNNNIVINNINSNSNKLSKQVMFSLKNYYEPINNNTVESKEKAITFFNYILSDGNNGSIIIYNWFEIFRVVIVYYDSYVLETLLEHNEKFKSKYNYYLNHYFKEMLEIHFKRNKNTKQFNYNNISIFIKHLNSIELTRKKMDQLFKKLKSKKCIMLLNLFFKYYSINQQQLIIQQQLESNQQIELPISPSQQFKSIDEIYSNFKSLYSYQVHLDINQIVQIYNNLDQDSVYSFFKDRETNPFYLYKSNILIYNLIKSIIFKEYPSILEIISVLNNNINNNKLPTIQQLIDIGNNNSSDNNSNNNNSDYNNNSSKEIIRYLYSNGYLQLFNLECLLDEIFKQIDVDKQFIFDLIPLNRSELKDQYQAKYYESITLKYYDNDDKKQEEKEEDQSKSLVMLLYEGYYQKVWEYFQKNEPIKKLEVTDLIYRDLPLEWFKRFYDPLIKVHLEDLDKVLAICLYRFDILEFLWINHLNQDQKKDLILTIFSEMNNMNYHPIIEYILKEKKQFIQQLELDDNYINKLHRNALVDGDISIYQLIRSTFNSFNFQIDFSIIRDVIQYQYDSSTARYDVIEYLYDNNLIPNFKDIIKNQKLLIREFNNRFIIPNDHSTIVVTRSMFILIYSIIRLQELKYENNQIINHYSE